MFNLRNKKNIYLDHASSTPIRYEVKKVLKDLFDKNIYGNSSSSHYIGQRNKQIIEDARDNIARNMSCNSREIIFTSGGTESNNLAIKGLYWAMHDKSIHYKCNKNNIPYMILVSKIEHYSVLKTVKWLERKEHAKLIWIPVDKCGIVDTNFISYFVKNNYDKIAIIILQSSNSEIGSIQPIYEISKLAKKFNIPIHSDIVQSCGIKNFNFCTSQISSVSISGHKIGGLPGAGLLILKNNLQIVPLHHGGEQEKGIRSGTLNVYSIVSISTAIDCVKKNIDYQTKKFDFLSKKLINGVKEIIPHAKLNGPHIRHLHTKRLPNNVNFLFPHCNHESLLFLFDHFGICTSYGTACMSGAKNISNVLLSIGLTEKDALSAQRFTLGHSSEERDIDYFLDVLPNIYRKASSAGI